MATFGNTTTPNQQSGYNYSTSSINYSKFVLAETANVTSMSCAFYYEDTPTNMQIAYAIYSHNPSTNRPDALLASTALTPFLITTTMSWYSINLTTNLSAGTYWLAYLFNASSDPLGKFFTGGVYEEGVQLGFCDTVYENRYSSFPNPAETNFLYPDFGFSIYATYTPSPAPVADFTATPLKGRSPLSVQFTDTSTNTPTSWTWSFGDGAVSNDQNPVHIFRSGGTPDVSLTATNDVGSDTETKTDYLNISPPGNSTTFYYKQEVI